MAARTVPMRIGGVDLLVETMPLAGSEQTSKLDKVGGEVIDAFERANDAIIGVATSTVDAIRKTASNAVHPEQIEVEFGLKFSATGNVIVAGISGEATLLVRLSYNTDGKSD